MEEENTSEVLMNFLDAEKVDDKIEILRKMQDDLDDKTIDAMAVALDTQIPEGPVYERYNKLMEQLRMIKKYEFPDFR
ncbi:MAG: hypothetical protein K6F99_01245 [Lachnospiraceae bacterium]|nr:hypothetical protein [Lachnospiraceae bacterium]